MRKTNQPLGLRLTKRTATPREGSRIPASGGEPGQRSLGLRARPWWDGLRRRRSRDAPDRPRPLVVVANRRGADPVAARAISTRRRASQPPEGGAVRHPSPQRPRAFVRSFVRSVPSSFLEAAPLGAPPPSMVRSAPLLSSAPQRDAPALASAFCLARMIRYALSRSDLASHCGKLERS